MQQMNKKIRSIFSWYYHYLIELFSQFINGRGFKNAASLSYTTLLSIVPLIAVIFSLFSHLPVFKDISEVIQEFVFNNFVPSFGRTVQNYLIQFSFNASKLTVTGIFFLVFVALMLMANIDTALNNIWHVSKKRKPVYRFLIYWAILTLGPVLIGAGLYSTSYLLSLPLIGSVNESLMIKARTLALLPFITTSLAFTFLYFLVPNAYVRLGHSLIGGITAAILFEFAKYTFGVYIRAVPTYENIYGAFAVIPMFLVWIYVSWVIVLFGGQIAYVLSVFRMKNGKVLPSSERWDFFDVYRIMAELWSAQKEGVALSEIDLKNRGVMVSHVLLNKVLDMLDKKKWISRNDEGRWLLSRDVDDISLNDIYQITHSKLPEDYRDIDDPWQEPLVKIFREQHENRLRYLDRPIGQLFRETIRSRET